jgi:predicted lipoprotein with Yx(FWY)xxD motif
MKQLATTVISRGSNPARVARVALGAIAAGSLGLAATMAAATGVSPTIKSVSVPNFAGALANQSSHSLYILTSEKGAKFKCMGSCLTSWPPLEVPTSTKSIHLGPGVKGKIGFVARGASKKQVTFNSYPLYTFAGDSDPRQSNGQGIREFGGTWTLVRASATTAGSTSFTSTTSGGGGGGY